MRSMILKLSAILLVVIAVPSWADPTISIDLDPATAGIQSELSVSAGSSFTVDVVFTGDGATNFDAFGFSVAFNDAGVVLGLTGGSELATAGEIASRCLLGCENAYTDPAVPVKSDDLLTGSSLFPLETGFIEVSNGFGISSPVFPFNDFAPIGVGETIDLFSLTFDALVPGTSSVMPSLGIITPTLSLGGLAFTNTSVDHGLTGGTVTVTSTPTTSAPTAPGLISPENNETGVGIPVTFSWEASTDADGDTLQYTLSVCEFQDFNSCTPEVVATKDFSIMVAGLGSGTGMLLWVGLVMPAGRPRRKRWVYTACLVSLALLMASCGSSSSGTTALSHTVTGLSPGTQYYWKVTVTDLVDSTDSEVWSFTTL